MLNELAKSEKVVGIKQTMKAVTDGNAVKVFIAEDAEERVRAPLAQKCAESGVELEGVPSMLELGKACGIDVGSAAAAIIRCS